MNTLHSEPMAPLVERLFAEAKPLNSAGIASAFAGISDAERSRLLASKTAYLEVYSRLKDAPLAVSRETGALLYMLARACRARAIVEFGTSFGLSTLHLAAALRDNGGGMLITSEFEPSKIHQARQHLEAAGVMDLVEIREGDARDSLARDLPEAIDLVLLDGAKSLYCDILDRLEPHLRPGTLIVADNADMSPDYLARVRGSAGYMSVPFGEDVELSTRLGAAA